MSSIDQKLILESKEYEQFTVNKKGNNTHKNNHTLYSHFLSLLVCSISILVTTVSDALPNRPIPLQLSSRHIKKMIEFMEHYDKDSGSPYAVYHHELIELLEAANYMEIEPLCEILRRRIKSIIAANPS